MSRRLLFFNDTATTEIYTLSLHDALPISMRIAMVSEHASPLAVLGGVDAGGPNVHVASLAAALGRRGDDVVVHRSEGHTAELQARQYVVCRVLLETKIQSCS